MTTPEDLTIDRNLIHAFGILGRVNACDPRFKAGLKRSGAQCSQEATDRIVRGNAVW